MCDSCFLAIANLLLSKRERQSENPAAQPGQAKPSSIKSQPASFLLAKNYPLADHSSCPPARALTLISLTAGPFSFWDLLASRLTIPKPGSLGVSVGRRNSRGASQGGVSSTPVHKKCSNLASTARILPPPSRNLLPWFWDCAARRLQDTR